MITLVITAIILVFGLGAWLGAPYLPVLGPDVENLLDLADLKAGQTIVDLGAGDGRLLKAAARRGITAIGYEINPLLVLVAKLNCWRYRQLVTIKWANYWRINWPKADAIYVFLIERYMPKLDQELERRIKQPTKLVSYVFAIPDLKPVATTKNSYLYRYPKS